MEKIAISKMIGLWDNAQDKNDIQIKENAEGEISRMINSNDEFKKWKDKGQLEWIFAGSSQKGTDITEASDLDVQIVFNKNGQTLKQNKDKVHEALKSFFGKDNVTKTSIAFRIKGHSNRKPMDVVAMEKISNEETYALKNDSEYVSYYHALDVKNINAINAKYDHRYSNMVRAFKGLREEMKANNKLSIKKVPSFTIECALYAVKKKHYNFERNRYKQYKTVEEKTFHMFTGLLSAIESGILGEWKRTKKKLEINQKKLFITDENYYKTVKAFFAELRAYLKDNYIWA